MSSTNDAIRKLYRIRKTVLQMLDDRGYLVTDDEINMAEEQFIEHYGENMKREDLFIHKGKQNDSSDQIFVFFLVPEPKKSTIGVNPLKKCIQKMMSENVVKAIVVAQNGYTASAKKAIQGLPRMTMKMFEDAELISNVMKHELVPKHQVLKDEEKKALLHKYSVGENQLPRMLVSDPIARYFGLRRGQVVKIIRPSENAGKYVTYRYVS